MLVSSYPMAVRWIWVSLALVGAVDVVLPLGYAIPLAYIPLVALTLRIEDRDRAVLVAATATVLTVLGAAIDRPTGPLAPGWFNRGLALVAIWVTASGVSRYRRLESDLRRQRADAELGRMATLMAHEWHNPLAGVTAALQILQARLQDTTAQSITGEAISRLRRLSDLVDALLRFARPVSARPDRTALRVLLAEVADIAAHDPLCRGLTVERDGVDGWVLADRRLTVDVLLALIHNASHPTVGATRVVVRAVRVGDRWDLQVVDNGRGVPLDRRATLGDPFATDRSDRPGLGLAIARRQLEAQGGRLRHIHPADGGTIAVAGLPAART